MTKAILYHCRDARSLRPLWAAEEVGFSLDLVTLPFPPRVFAPEFKETNPLGTIPAWAENGQLLTESAAICQRIAHGTALEVTPDEADWPLYLNWLHRSDATLTFPLTIVLRYTRLEQGERRLAQAVEDYTAFFHGRARSIESALADGRDYLVAGRCTLADITVGYALFLARSLKLDGELGPLSCAWLDRLMARPAFIRARALGTDQPASIN
jgi:glutathione S-transferase